MILDMRRDSSDCLRPPFVAFSSLKQRRIKKIRFLAANRFNRHNIYNPFPAIKFEVQAITDEHVRSTKGAQGMLSANQCSHCLSIAQSNAAPGKADIPFLLSNRVPFKEYAFEQRGSCSLSFSASVFLPDTPGMFADAALSATLAETIYVPSATERFRVLCCHTRESWQKTTDLI